jgi:hypothetical protein
VIAGAITPSGYSNACLCGFHSQDGAGTAHGWKPIGGWKFGNTIDGCQAEYVLVPDAMANLAPVPDGLADEQVLMCPDIMSTGLSGAESGLVRIGDAVAVFAQGPIGLWALSGTYGPPRRQAACSSWRDQSAPTYPVSGMNPGQDGGPRVPILIISSASRRHSRHQVFGMPVDCQAISLVPPADIVGHSPSVRAPSRSLGHRYPAVAVLAS